MHNCTQTVFLFPAKNRPPYAKNNQLKTANYKKCACDSDCDAAYSQRDNATATDQPFSPNAAKILFFTIITRHSEMKNNIIHMAPNLLITYHHDYAKQQKYII